MRSLVLAALVGIGLLGQARAGGPRAVIPLNEDWLFHPGALEGAEAPAIDDAAWRTVRFALDGPATIAGIGNGDPLCLDPFQDETHPLFYGKAILILRSRYGEPGMVHIRAGAEGLQPAVATVTVN